MKVVNSVALPIVGLVKRTLIKLEGWKGLVDFVVVKMDDFDVVLGMEFLLEHQVIPMPSAKCLAITGSFPTVVQADICQPNRFKMISAMQLDKSLVQEEPPSKAIPLGALGKLGETVPKDNLCIPEKYHGVLSMKKKDRNSQQRIKCSILNKLTASRKYPFPILPNLFDRSSGVKYFPKSDIRSRHCRVRTTKTEGLETPCITGLRAYEFPVVPFSLTDAKGGKCCSMQRQINVLGHVVEFHQIEVGKRKIAATCDGRIPKSFVELRSCPGRANSNGQFMEGFLKRASSLTELLKEENIQWGGNLKHQAAFDGRKQATIEGPSLGVVDANKPPKVEAEQFNCMLGEYLHHFVDGRQRNWVQMLNVAPFGHDAQTDSLIRRSQFEINDSRHSVLPPVIDDPYWEQPSSAQS
ncbi:reverse transcriptase [Cucumis melo var. makuwa]|uniref:Reverse transcriptase n=1 Tax=Cucumis melo var. makuwa TaxID=1194695 RepID=A0A5A7UQU1_CUCMM|nr:reverse transcriptase [Cucumis melo var. makuwa]TYK30166.1 reverse transcriptase [Cucumis melo var. makuwa]